MEWFRGLAAVAGILAGVTGIAIYLSIGNFFVHLVWQNWGKVPDPDDGLSVLVLLLWPVALAIVGLCLPFYGFARVLEAIFKSSGRAGEKLHNWFRKTN